MKFIPRSRATRTERRASSRSTWRNSAPSDEAPKLRKGSFKLVLPSWRCSIVAHREKDPAATKARRQEGNAMRFDHRWHGGHRGNHGGEMLPQIKRMKTDGWGRKKWVRYLGRGNVRHGLEARVTRMFAFPSVCRCVHRPPYSSDNHGLFQLSQHCPCISSCLRAFVV